MHLLCRWLKSEQGRFHLSRIIELKGTYSSRSPLARYSCICQHYMRIQIIGLRRTDSNDVKRQSKVPALYLNEAEHQTPQTFDLFECDVIDIKGKCFRHVAQAISEHVL